MLWDLIRDFFVRHIFGGITSEGAYFTCCWGLFANDDFIYSESNSFPMFKIGQVINFSDDIIYNYVSCGDWLSTTATIITITIIVVLCCLFVYKIIKLIGGLIR